jgi:cell division protein FtsL
MDRAKKISQAYSQKPWRRELQRIGLFFSILVVLALVAGVNLRVNAEAATIGQRIQEQREMIKDLEYEIINQQALLAELTSAAVMSQRAQELGFRPATSDEITYLVVDGYGGRTPAVLAVEGKSFVQTTTTRLPPEFTKTLFDILLENLSFARLIYENQRP